MNTTIISHTDDVAYVDSGEQHNYKPPSAEEIAVFASLRPRILGGYEAHDFMETESPQVRGS